MPQRSWLSKSTAGRARRTLLPALALLITAGCAQRPPTSTPEPVDATLSRIEAHAADSRLGYALVAELTTIGSRIAGGPNDARAREWAMRTLTDLGYDRVWTEAVRFPVWERGPARATLTRPDQLPAGLAILALGGSMGTPAGGLTAPVVRFESFEALRDAPADAAAGKIVFIDRRMDRSIDGSGYGAAVAARVQGPSVAAQKGALALLIRSVGTDADSPNPHTGTLRYDQTPTRIPAAALSHTSADQLAAALAQGPASVALDMAARTRGEDYEGANVIAEITGVQRPEEIVLLGAHLDSWDVGTGALDDASGIGITFAAPVLLKQLGLRPDRTIRVVAFANEEQGLYGGNAYGLAHAAAGPQHALAMEADFGDGRVYRVDTPLLAERRNELAPLLAALGRLGIAVGEPRANGGPDLRGIAAQGATLVDLKQDGNRYFDYHHTAGDTLDKVDPAAIRQVTTAFALTTWYFARSDWQHQPGTPTAR